jgi:hypothetical protein
MRATKNTEIRLNFLRIVYADLRSVNSGVGTSTVAVGDGNGVLGFDVFVGRTELPVQA